MDKLTENIKKTRPNIKKSTIDSYIKSLKVLNGGEFKNIDFLNNYDNMIKKIKEFKPATQKAKLASILVALGTKEKKPEELYKKYNDKLHEISKAYYTNIANNKKTEKQSESWVDLKKLMKVLNHHIRLVKKENIHKRDDKKLNKRQKKILQEYLLTSLYLLQPPRRNVYADTKVISSKEFNELTESDRKDNNYLVIQSRNKKFFSFGDYKTKKKYGQQRIDVSKKLNSVINLWRYYNPDAEYLLYNSRGDKMTKNSLTKHLQQAFKISGKNNISSTMLRHIYITAETDRKAYEKVAKMAKDMGHSVEEQQKTYYKKE